MTHPRKFGNHVTVHRPPDLPSALHCIALHAANTSFEITADSCKRVFQRFDIRSLRLSFEKNFHPFERLGKLSSFRTARVIRLKKIVIRSNGSSYPFKTIVTFATVPKHFHPSHLRRTYQKNLSLNNSYKRCLPSPHEFSRYIFY